MQLFHEKVFIGIEYSSKMITCVKRVYRATHKMAYKGCLRQRMWQEGKASNRREFEHICDR